MLVYLYTPSHTGMNNYENDLDLYLMRHDGNSSILDVICDVEYGFLLHDNDSFNNYISINVYVC